MITFVFVITTTLDDDDDDDEDFNAGGRGVTLSTEFGS